MLILEELDYLEHILTKDTVMSFEIVRESKIVGRSELGHTGECDLTSDFGQASNETIESIIYAILLYLVCKLLLSLKKYSWHSLHKIVNKHTESSCCRKSPC